jgi:hypothetical protein
MAARASWWLVAPACRGHLYTMNQFIEHLSKGLIPGVIENAVSGR